mmetsp:Transcript_1406/g.5021  ORF Transcript_1406/g.5021 Transcript_1406/m.5021 type:complete len:207 (+) Transcript_1406:352-972(+)
MPLPSSLPLPLPDAVAEPAGAWNCPCSAAQGSASSRAEPPLRLRCSCSSACLRCSCSSASLLRSSSAEGQAEGRGPWARVEATYARRSLSLASCWRSILFTSSTRRSLSMRFRVTFRFTCGSILLMTLIGPVNARSGGEQAKPDALSMACTPTRKRLPSWWLVSTLMRASSVTLRSLPLPFTSFQSTGRSFTKSTSLNWSSPSLLS